MRVALASRDSCGGGRCCVFQSRGEQGNGYGQYQQDRRACRPRGRNPRAIHRWEDDPNDGTHKSATRELHSAVGCSADRNCRRGMVFPPPDARCHLYNRCRVQRGVRTRSLACESKFPSHHTERGSSAGQPAEGHGVDPRRRVLDGGAGPASHAPTDHPVPLDDYLQWWSYVKGANWRHPLGPESDVKGKGTYPVVHVAYEDALAYAT
jgi:Sulfatase-modifying factor enzyme 1